MHQPTFEIAGFVAAQLSYLLWVIVIGLVGNDSSQPASPVKWGLFLLTAIWGGVFWATLTVDKFLL